MTIIRRLLKVCGHLRYVEHAAAVIHRLGGPSPADMSQIVCMDDATATNGIDIGPDYAFGDCAICLEVIEYGTHRALEECKHIFHETCVGRWLEKNESCPYCRGRIDIEKLIGGVSLNEFAQRYIGQTLESLLLALFELVLKVHQEIEKEEGDGHRRVSLVQTFCIAKMVRLLIDETLLSAQNKNELRKVQAIYHMTVHAHTEQEILWIRICKKLNLFNMY